jgi:hypothetical protein
MSFGLYRLLKEEAEYVESEETVMVFIGRQYLSTLNCVAKQMRTMCWHHCINLSSYFTKKVGAQLHIT